MILGQNFFFLKHNFNIQFCMIWFSQPCLSLKLWEAGTWHTGPVPAFLELPPRKEDAYAKKTTAFSILIKTLWNHGSDVLATLLQMHIKINEWADEPVPPCTTYSVHLTYAQWRVDHLWGINAVQCTAGRYMTEVSAEAVCKIRKEERSKKDRKRGTENFSADSGLRFKT